MPTLNAAAQKWTEEDERRFSVIAQNYTRTAENLLLPIKQVQEAANSIMKSFLPMQEATDRAIKSMVEPANKSFAEWNKTIVKSLSISMPAHFPRGYTFPGIVRTPPIDTQVEKDYEVDDKVGPAAPQPQKNYKYTSETKTLIIKKVQWCAINFEAKSGNSDMPILFGVFYDCLEERGEIEGDYKIVFITTEEIVRRLAEKGKRNVDTSWIKSTKSNIVNHKIPPYLSDAVVISEFDRKQKGYHFKIKITSFDPSFN